MDKRICIVDGCTKKRHVAAGYCNMHYARVKAHGTPNPPTTRWPRRGLICTIDGCDKPQHSGKYGWCQMHYQRWAKHGDPLKTLLEMGNGDNVTISAVHWRLVKRRGPAKQHQCVDCKQRPARHWSYDHSDHNERRCPVHGPYSTNLDAYQPRCVPCHKRFDLQRLGKTPRTCTIDGCQRPHCAHGWCSMHYKRAMKARNKQPG